MFHFQPIRRLLPAWPLRLVALGCAGLVGLLGLAAVSPEIHAALHDASFGQSAHAGECGHGKNLPASDHVCAVTLFSQGFESGFTPVVAPVVPAAPTGEVIALADQVARAARAAQLPPACGPPVR